MAKIAVFLPREYMLEQVERVVAEMNMELLMVKVIDSSDTLEQARLAISQGAQIVVARGLHALIIERYTKVPVVEITLTAQELGLLITKAKRFVQKEHPVIALIGYRNLLSDVTYFNEIFGVDLTAYYVDDPDEVEGIVSKAVKKKPDMVIGGDLVGNSMKKYSIPYMFFHSTEDSIRNALQVAGKMAYTADVEKISNAQFATMADTTFQGIIKIDGEHRITAVNRMAKDYLKKSPDEVVGHLLEDELKDIDAANIDGVLSGQREMYSTTIRIHGVPMRYIAAPIQYDGHIDGAILSFTHLYSRQSTEENHMKTGYLQGYVAAMDFSMMKTTDRRMKAAITLAKQYAASRFPVLIRDEMGYNKEKIAQCIHNNSARRSMPFVSVNLSGMNEQAQMNALFGSYRSEDNGIPGIAQRSDLGTLFINEIENLSPFCQYQVYRLIRRRLIVSGDAFQTKILDVRLIAGTRKDLRLLVADGRFRSDLYYAIAGLYVELTPIRERSGDIERTINEYLKAFCTRNSCYLTLTEGAMKVLCDYSWEGNEIQMENFCERLFLTTTRKTINETAVRNLLQLLYPQVEEIDGNKRLVVYQAPEARQLADLLEACGGNRQMAAKQLGISTTTLWRRMKKYGIIHGTENEQQ